MIEVRNLTKYYGNGESRFKALDDVTVNISDGEFIVILGASGSGKSTFLYVISGLEEIDGGSVTYDGRQLENMSEKELTKFRRDNTAYIFQQYYLLPHLNVEKNIKMGADLDHNKDFLPLIEAVGKSSPLSSAAASSSASPLQERLPKIRRYFSSTSRQAHWMKTRAD